MNPKRTYRLWAAAQLQLPRKRRRRRVADPRPRPESPTGPNHVWAYDFVFDRTPSGSDLGDRQQMDDIEIIGTGRA